MKPIASLYVSDPVSGYITIFTEGKQQTIRATDANFANACVAYEKSDWEALESILNPSIKFNNLYAKYEQIEVKDGHVYVSGEAISSLVAGRILDYLSKDIDCTPVFKFITKLNLNPSKRAVDELYTFLEHKYLPITENGNFLAYKALRSDRPADGKLVVVEINPADVVSIPIDCEFQKLRTCKYKVHSEYEVPLEDLLYESRFTTDNDEDVDREWDNDGKFACSGCGWNRHMCEECDYCVECCDCSQDDDGYEEPEGGCMADPDAPKTEVQLELNLDNKMEDDDWKVRRFNYDKMLTFLYANRRPAVANALRSFYRDADHHQYINPEFTVLLNFTSDEDAYKIYLGYDS